jgi:Domain of unknown function (DUF4483)
MNKLAAVSGVTHAREQHAFRAAHPARLRSGDAVHKAPPPVPSDTDPAFTYGMPGTHRSAEQVRNAGPSDPPTKPLIQNQYANAWIKMNAVRAATFDSHSGYIPPRGTAATAGHRAGAALSLRRAHGAQQCASISSACTGHALSLPAAKASEQWHVHYAALPNLVRRAFQADKEQTAFMCSVLNWELLRAGELPASGAASFKLSKFTNAQPKLYDHLAGVSAPAYMTSAKVPEAAAADAEPVAVPCC